jgi:ribosomal protein S18 acetylase RimI-like enzyme
MLEVDADSVGFVGKCGNGVPEGAPKYCWCAYFRMRSTEFSTATVVAHRAALERAVNTAATEKRAAGLLAYRDRQPLGWISVGPRIDYERLQHSRALAPIDEHPVWSVVCFVVSPEARGQGVARTLASPKSS